MPHALIIEDDEDYLQALSEVVRKEDFKVTTAGSLAAARAAVSELRPDVLLVDIHLPDGLGLDFLDELDDPTNIDVILTTGQATVDTAIEALRHGVADFLTKPVDFARLKMTLGNIARTRALRSEIGMLRGELRKLGRFGSMIGNSSAMQPVYDQIARVAQTDATVFITGETGSGKEVVASTIHELSRRANKAFVPMNCGAISPNLIESELFGHERGSFTGAERAHKGFFERADGGTLFLDEVTEMSADLQVKLLRALETSQVMRVGGNDSIEVDVRVIAATNRSPDDAVAQGKLRQDLLYRLNVFPIQLPPLRARNGDIGLLATYFLEQLNRKEGSAKAFSGTAIERLRMHDWPGNVRELRNTVQRAYILAENEIGPESLPLPGKPTASPAGPNTLSFAPGTSLADVERQMILVTLQHYDGDKKRTADSLGMSLKTLYNRLNLYRER